jgi:hypothetical protein
MPSSRTSRDRLPWFERHTGTRLHPFQLGDEILAELEGPVQEMNKGEPMKSKQGDKRRVELPFCEGVNVVSDGGGEH